MPYIVIEALRDNTAIEAMRASIYIMPAQPCMP